MKFVPTNRHIMVEPIEEMEEKNDSVIVLPSDYEKPTSPYLRCKVLDVSGDSKYALTIPNGAEIVIERRMLHKIEFDDEEVYLILENYVFGEIKR